MNARPHRGRRVADRVRARQTLRRFQKSVDEIGLLPIGQERTHRAADVIHDEASDVGRMVDALVEDNELIGRVMTAANRALKARESGARAGLPELARTIDEVSSPGHALMVLGVDVVSEMAANLRISQSLKSAAEKMPSARQIVARTMFADALIARLAPMVGRKDTEELQALATLGVLGQLLVAYYLPEDWKQVQKLIVADRLTMRQACERTLGLGDTDLAAHAARRWHLPEEMTRFLRSRDGDEDRPDARAGDHERGAEGMNRAWARFALEMAEAVGRDADPVQIADTCSRYESKLKLGADALGAEVRGVRSDAMLRRRLEVALGPETSGFGRPVKPEDAALRLDRSLAEIALAWKTVRAANEVLQIFLDTLRRAYGARRVVLFVRQMTREAYTARLFSGDTRPEHRYTNFGAIKPQEALHAAMDAHVPVVIGSTRDPAQRARLSPFMERDFSDAGSCGVVPVVAGKRIPMIVYFDWASRTEVDADELRALRDFASTIAMVVQALRFREGRESGEGREV